MPAVLVGILWSLLFLLLPADAFAVTIASQDQAYLDTLNVWQSIQELGDNLSGTAQSFTFRVSTAKSNLDQFDYTAGNTRIYDKTNNTNNNGCVSSNTNPNDPTRGLTFNTTGVPVGFEDVTVDFSCRNYQFISGHRYLIQIINANMARFGGKKILFAAAAYGLGGHYNSDQFTAGGVRYAFDNGVCSAGSYVWNSSINNNGCNIWTNKNDDLYFVLTNNALPPPPPRLPVVFIPGIGGSELKVGQQIFWKAPDGHGGEFNHGYEKDEKVWVNEDKAKKRGDDDYFDVLRLKPDGVTSEADLSLTGDLTSQGYGNIDSFFTDMGYTKGTNFFTFAYDWRKDVRENKDSLDSLIEQAKTSSGQSQVNLVVHSMGGLVARYYISDSTKASKINKLIELGVPHLGTPRSLKTLLYGIALEKNVFGFIPIGIPASETNDVYQNFASGFQLLPSKFYYDFYNNSDYDHPYPFRDERDIDNNKITGDLNYDQIKNLLSNLNHNMTVFGFGEQFHNELDPIFNQNNGVKIYEIAGSAQPTLGQIWETWLISWPVNLIPFRDEIFINGDGTVPFYSASLISSSLDLSGGSTLYTVEQEHSALVNKDGDGMKIVKAILNEDNALLVQVKSEKYDLEGEQISLDDGELELYDEGKHTGINENGEIEENIPDTFYSTSGETKHAFVKKKSKKVVVKTTRKKPTNSSKKINLKIRTYKKDKISKTTLYKDIPLTETTKAEFILDPSSDISPSLIFYADETKTDNVNINPTSEATGSAALDQTPPSTSIQVSGTKDSSGIYTGPVTITLAGTDTNSGILRIEYSLDNGVTVQTYSNPFTISTPGKTTLQVKSIDKLGNEEIPQAIIIEIATPPSPTPAPSSSNSTSGTSLSSNNSNTNTSEEPKPFSEVRKLAPTSSDILGVSFDNPSHISDEINVSGILDELKNPEVPKITGPSAKQVLGGLLIVSAGIITIASLGLATTFFTKPTPK